MYLGMEKTVFFSGRYPKGAVCFYGALLSLFEQGDEPGVACRESGRSECIPVTSESEAIGD